jgi:hypothetical protein
MADIAPAPRNPERVSAQYERKFAVPNPARRGPLRFEEGIATDTDVPNDFALGVSQGYITAPGRPNHNANVWEKSPQETMKERAHVGSSAWVESQSFLGEFAHGSFADASKNVYEEVIRDHSSRHMRQNPAVIYE